MYSHLIFNQSIALQNSRYSIKKKLNGYDIIDMNQQFAGNQIRSIDPLQVGPSYTLNENQVKKLNCFFNYSNEIFWKKGTIYHFKSFTFTFTHDVLKRSKNELKLDEYKFEFIDTEKPLGEGVYGGVYQIASTLSFVDDKVLYKNRGMTAKKSNKIKDKVVKIGELGLFERNVKLVPHLGYKPSAKMKSLSHQQSFSLYIQPAMFNLDNMFNENILRNKANYILEHESLYYINPEGKKEKVPIHDFLLFQKELNSIKKNMLHSESQDNLISLSSDDIFKLITQNGGHIPFVEFLVMNKVPGLPVSIIKKKIDSIEKKIEFTEQLLVAVKNQLNNISHNDLHQGNIMVDISEKPMLVNFIDYGAATKGSDNKNISSLKNILSEIWGLHSGNKKHDINQQKMSTFLSKSNKSFTLDEFKKIQFNIEDGFLNRKMKTKK